MSACFGMAWSFKYKWARAANVLADLCMWLLVAAMMNGCDRREVRLVVTKPITRDTVVTRVYVCRIHSCRHMEIRANTRGHLEVVNARAGCLIKAGDEMFKILPHAPGVAMKSAGMESSSINAPFSGRMDRLRMQGGSLVTEGDVLTTLSDNSEMWVDFNVPEAQHSEYVKSAPNAEVKLVLANGRMFDQSGRVEFIKTEVNSRTGSIPSRAIFPNPQDLLRNGGTGNVRMQNTIKNALLVPRKSTFELQDHRCIYVLDKDNIVRQKRISIIQELEDFFNVSDGVSENDTIIYEGVRQVKEGEKVDDYVFEEPAKAYEHLKSTVH